MTHTRLAPGESLVADLSDVSVAGPSGVVWALDSPQLNANLVTLHPGDHISEHVNDEVDVLIVTNNGSGTVSIDDARLDLGPTSIALIPRGSRRSIRSEAGLAYYSIHQRRGGLSVGGTR